MPDKKYCLKCGRELVTNAEVVIGLCVGCISEQKGNRVDEDPCTRVDMDQSLL